MIQKIDSVRFTYREKLCYVVIFHSSCNVVRCIVLFVQEPVFRTGRHQIFDNFEISRMGGGMQGCYKIQFTLCVHVAFVFQKKFDSLELIGTSCAV